MTFLTGLRAGAPVAAAGTKKAGGTVRFSPGKAAKQAKRAVGGQGTRRVASDPNKLQLLSRVEELRLLSRAEQAGLLSLLQKNGITLTYIEKSGLLSKAESLGLLSAAADRNLPGLLTAGALALFVVGPAVAYLTPDTSPLLIGVQVVAALACVAGGSAALGGAQLLTALQRSS